MKRLLATTVFAALAVSNAQALELAWKGGAVVTAASAGCNGYPSVNNDWYAYLWPPLANTTNTTNSTFTLHNGTSSEGFRLKTSGSFSSAFKAVEAVHVYTGAGSYSAQLKIVSQTPATIVASTPIVSGVLQINKWDNWNSNSTCLVTIKYSLVRHVEHQ